jgi:integral membrane protein (TIGR01906 family)
VGFDQDRSDVARLTGYSPAEVTQVTGSILSDLVFGPPNFDVKDTITGAPVLDAGERSHMADVRTVVLDLGRVALIAAAVLLVAGLGSRGAGWFWRAVNAGARVLVAGVIVVGLAFAVFFDQAFELFHEIFFAPGSYTFDSKSEKLVQLFPDQFWSETSVAIAVAVLILGVGLVFASARLSPESSTAAQTGSAPTAGSAAAPEGRNE